MSRSRRPRGDGRTCFTVTTHFTMSENGCTPNRPRQPPGSGLRRERRGARSWGQPDQPRPETMLRSGAADHPEGLSGPGGPVNLVGLGRFERPTSRLSGVRSNQLSYRPRSENRSKDQIPCGIRPLIRLFSGRDAPAAARGQRFLRRSILRVPRSHFVAVHQEYPASRLGPSVPLHMLLSKLNNS